MTLTTPTCPSAGAIVAEIKQKVSKLIIGEKKSLTEKVTVNLVFDPPWKPTMITKKGRKLLPSQVIDFIDFS
ncbi:MAG: metal-sulfur cluster assembly factor [Candidatus Hodarchaeales archaeon]|jgi:metal-sulfur cluster biosynthetic enzyme